MKVELAGVPGTLLWTLWHRAVEARRADTLLDDPKAVELVAGTDYPFAEQRRGNHGGQGYQPPPWLWAVDSAKRRALAADKLRFPRGRGLLRLLPISPIEILRAPL